MDSFASLITELVENELFVHFASATGVEGLPLVFGFSSSSSLQQCFELFLRLRIFDGLLHDGGALKSQSAELRLWVFPLMHLKYSMNLVNFKWESNQLSAATFEIEDLKLDWLNLTKLKILCHDFGHDLLHFQVIFEHSIERINAMSFPSKVGSGFGTLLEGFAEAEDYWDAQAEPSSRRQQRLWRLQRCQSCHRGVEQFFKWSQ